MLALFKGELSYTDIVDNMVYKDMMALRDARIERLTNERKEMEKDKKEMERQRIRNTLLSTDPDLRKI